MPQPNAFDASLYKAVGGDKTPAMMVRRLLNEPEMVELGLRILKEGYEATIQGIADNHIATYPSSKFGNEPSRIEVLKQHLSDPKLPEDLKVEIERIAVEAERIRLKGLELDHNSHEVITSLVEVFHNDPDARFVFEFAKQWARSGFPRAIVGHKLAASFMATGADPHVLEHVIAPWAAWQITVPNGLASVVVGSTEEEIERLLILSSGDIWRICAMTRTTQMWRRGPLVDLISDDMGFESSCAKPHDDRDTRVWTVLIRYAIGLCLELGDRGMMDQITRQRDRQQSKRAPGTQPSVWKFEVRRDIVVDCREAIQQYVKGTRRNAPVVQVLVRGHWKRQAHGPALSQRKVIQVEPYWRGPEDAPIAVRGHVLPDESLPR